MGISFQNDLIKGLFRLKFTLANLYLKSKRDAEIFDGSLEFVLAIDKCEIETVQ